MVFVTVSQFAKRKSLRQYLKSGFIDSLRIHVRGGSGGNGLPKFGGVGGQGGDVILKAKEFHNLEMVLKQHSTKRIHADHGKHSSHNFILGPPAENIEVVVPTGVTIYCDNNNLGELNKDGEELVVAKGGFGGHPKNGFLGQQGESKTLALELKLIADIGLVGFPNAGKSTLLKAVSHAKPKIASYPFTTIRPNLGIMHYKDMRQISMADLPGLIEGAHANRGMGHSFLRHVERTKLLLLVVDINGFQLSPQHEFRDCLDTIVLLNKELELYNEDLLNKPAMLLINKLDTEGAEAKYDLVREKLKDYKVHVSQYPDDIKPTRAISFTETMAISAKEGESTNRVKEKLRKLLDIFSPETEDNIPEDVRSVTRERGPALV